MTKKQLRLIILIFASILLLVYSIFEKIWVRQEPVSIVQVKVVKIFDGDTISVLLDGTAEKIRLVGIDAPELDQKPWGLKSKKHLEGLINLSNWTVDLEFDIERRDKYGRLLCYLFSDDKTMINLRMVQDGYAMLFTVPPNIKYADIFKDGQKKAREQKLGIWSSNGLKESPGDYRKRNPRKF